MHNSSTVQRRWWLVEEEEKAVAVQCKRRNDGLERQRCARWWEVCVRAVRDGGAELRWSSEKGGTVRCRRRNAGLERRRCVGWWELCVGGVLDGGSYAGQWRWSLEKMKAGRRWWSSQRNRRRCRCTMKKLEFFNPTKGYCLGYSKQRHIVSLLSRVGAWPRPIVSLLPRLLENRGILLQ